MQGYENSEERWNCLDKISKTPGKRRVRHETTHIVQPKATC